MDPHVPFRQQWLTARPATPASQPDTDTSAPKAPPATSTVPLEQRSDADGFAPTTAEPAEPPRTIPAAYLAPCWEGTVDMEQLRDQRRLGRQVAPPGGPGALTAPLWLHPPLAQPRRPLRRSAGLGELSGDGGMASSSARWRELARCLVCLIHT